jgi:C4-dicarboxylate-specific signal transduction histidine kinase
MAGKKSPCDNCLIEKVFHNNLLLKSEELLFNNRIYDVIMQPFSDVDGSKLVLRNLYDITERKEREQELSLLQAEMAQLERLNLVGQMAAYRTQI